MSRSASMNTRWPSWLAAQLGAQLCSQADARWQDLDGVLSAVTGTQAEVVAKAVMPFLLAEIVVIFLITYFPALTLTVPRLAGFVD